MAKKKISNNKTGWLCSGYGVAPNGEKCKGCIDCKFGKGVMTMAEIERDINSRVVRVGKGDTLETILGKIEKKRSAKPKSKKRK